MAQKRERIIAGFFAAVFIISTLAISVGVIFQMINDGKKSDQNKAQQAALQQIKDQKKESNVNQLKGTPLVGFSPITSIKELQSIDSTPGTGAEAKASDTITVDYTGAIASTGIIFESSKDSGQPATFPLSDVIKGWTQGIPGMKEGGTRRLLIPASLAYGNQANGSIPPNADLVFDVTLIKIGK